MPSSKDWNYRISKGLCGACGKRPFVINKKECAKCRDYRSAQQKARYHGGNGTLRAKQRIKERIEAGVCYNCKKKPAIGKKSCEECLAKHRNRTLKYKDICYEKYGGYICSCCGEKEKAFLTIDHINNNGANHRKQLGTKSISYKWIIDNKFPSDLQVLCYNCNCGRYHNGGICPHKSQVSEPLLS